MVGAGVAGAAAAARARRRGRRRACDRGAPRDRARHGAAALARRSASRSRPAATSPAHLDGATLVVTSPGVPPRRAGARRGRAERGIPVWGELELGARLCDVPYLAVTGTNGKTTTTGMIAACLRAGGARRGRVRQHRPPVPAGRARGARGAGGRGSSFQLRFAETFHPARLGAAEPRAGPPRLARIVRGVRRREGADLRAPRASDDVHVGNRDDPRRPRVSAGAPCPVVWFRPVRPSDGEVGYVHGELVSRMAGERDRSGRSEPTAPGIGPTPPRPPRRRSRSACRPRRSAQGLASFAPAPHRGDVVAVVDGVRSSTTRRPRTCTRHSPRSTASHGRRADRRRPRQGCGPVAARDARRIGSRASSRSARRAAEIVRVFDGVRARAPGATRSRMPRWTAFALAPPAGDGAARARLRELGHVPRLRRARRPVRGRRPRARWRRRWPVAERVAARRGATAKRADAPARTTKLRVVRAPVRRRTADPAAAATGGSRRT